MRRVDSNAIVNKMPNLTDNVDKNVIFDSSSAMPTKKYKIISHSFYTLWSWFWYQIFMNPNLMRSGPSNFINSPSYMYTTCTRSQCTSIMEYKLCLWMSWNFISEDFCVNPDIMVLIVHKSLCWSSCGIQISSFRQDRSLQSGSIVMAVWLLMLQHSGHN